MEELRQLKAKDKKLQNELAVIEESLTVKLKDDMTAAEIAAKSRELGL